MSPRALLLAVLLLPGVASGTNYLVIVADDLGTDKVGAWRHDYDALTTDGAFDETEADWLPATPNLDRLAAGGLRFTRAWASPVCSPTRATLQTGQHPFRNDVGWALTNTNEGPDWTSVSMLGDRFRAAGYNTALFGKWHLGLTGVNGTTDWTTPGTYADDSPPTIAGYQRFWGGVWGDVDDYWDWTRIADSLIANQSVVAQETGYVDAMVTDQAVDWINTRTMPWLAMVTYYAPHTDSSRVYHYGEVDPSCVQTPELLDCVTAGDCADEERATYQALTECLDTHIGDLLDGIDPDLLDDTLVVFLGDNGTPGEVAEWDFYAHDRGKTTPYETGVHVPLSITDGQAWAGDTTSDVLTSPGRIVALNAGVVDLLPTLVGHATGSAPTGLDGTSLVPCFTNTDSHCGRGTRTFGYTEAYYVLDSGQLDTGRAAVRYGDEYKLVIEYNNTSRCLDDTLYRTSTDPFETSPLTTPTTTITRMRTWFTSLAPTWAVNPGTGRQYRWCP